MMPEIETWSHLPAAVRAHLIERMHVRKISLQGLNRLRVSIESKPNVPEGLWYKDFGSFKLCGEGRYLVTRRQRICGRHMKKWCGWPCRELNGRLIP
jgi:hypothetical protein